MTLRVMGIDPSLTATGVCTVLLDADSWPSPTGPAPLDTVEHFVDVRTFSTSKPKLKTKREYSQRVTRVLDQVEEFLRISDLVSMESLAYAAKGEAVWVLPWIFGRVIDLCERYDKELIVVGTAQVKKYVTGKGIAPKEQALLATVRRFPQADIKDNNQADALVCAAVGCRYKGLPIDTVPKDHWVDVMKKIGT